MGILQKDNFVDDGRYNYRTYADALGIQDGEPYTESQARAVLQNELRMAQRERMGLPELRMNADTGDMYLHANTTPTDKWHAPTEELDTLIASYYVRSLLT